jgi:hypothetical protein
MYEPKLKAIDELTLEYSWICHSDHLAFWLGLQVGIWAFLLLLMSLTMYFVWKFSLTIAGHKYTIISIYNLIMIGCLTVVVYATTIETDEEVAITAMVTLLITITSSVLLNFHVALYVGAGGMTPSRISLK